jgi:glutaredoxin
MAADLRVDVLLLTREDCAFCEDAEKVLDRLGAEFPLSVRTVDYDSEEGARLALAGGLLFPPGILLDGRPFSYGRPSERKLRRELAHLAEIGARHA